MIYERLFKDIPYLSRFIEKGTNGGLMDLIINYHILFNKEILDIKIKQFIKIEFLVPNLFSINFFSNNKINKIIRKSNTINYDKIFYLEKSDKKKLEDENTFIMQELFCGNYYDCGLLMPCSGKSRHFIFIVFQMCIHKPYEDYLSKKEHELLLYHIKASIENKYDIIIDNAYFQYILLSINNQLIDKNTQKKNAKQYQIFDITSFTLIKKNNVNNKKKFITNKFFFHNEASLLKNYKNIINISFLEDKASLFDSNERGLSALKDEDNNDI